MDPYAVLGVTPGASAEEITAAYRARALEWHPDVRGSEGAALRMAAINAAYEVLRAAASPSGSGVVPGASASREGDRAMLGVELASALRGGESVVASASCSTWDSPRTYLVLTDSRLVWLLDDAVGHRVRTLALSRVASVSLRRARRRAVASLRVRPRGGKTLVFADLDASVAATLAHHLRTAVAISAPRG